jgi:hypothetical protein
VQIVDFSGGVVLNEALNENVHLISITQETTKQLPRLYILTRKGDIIHYTLNVKKTSKKNKIEYKLTLRYQFNLFLINPVESWPISF